MSLSDFAIKYRPVVVTIVTLLMVWGVLSVMTMPRREDPEYTVRTCVVSTAWPGAPAAADRQAAEQSSHRNSQIARRVAGPFDGNRVGDPVSRLL